MKKFFLLLACASMMATSAMAQMSLVKDLSKKASSNDPQALIEVMQGIMPAITNPESSKDALTWLTAGKAAFGLYDNLSAMMQLNQPTDTAMMVEMLMAGFGFIQEGLPLDSVKETNKDGSFKLDKNGQPKVKTKYSKEMRTMMANHINDLLTVAEIQYQREKYKESAECYGGFCELIQSDIAKEHNLTLTDDLMKQVRFAQGISQFYAKDYGDSYNTLTDAMRLGYTENNIDQYQAAALANMVQTKVDAQDYPAAFEFIEKALQQNPNNSIMWDMKGYVLEQDTAKVGADKAYELALAAYQKAVEIDPANADANLNVGRMFYNQAARIIQTRTELTTQQLVPLLQPIYEKAMPFFQKAASLDAEKAKSANRFIDDIKYKYEVMGIQM